MKPVTLEEAIEALEGTCGRPMPLGNVMRVETDSRAVASGDLFVAIRGPHFDGHDFVGDAFARGAVAAVVRSDFELPVPPTKRPGGTEATPGSLLIRVDDPVEAMGRLARYYRRKVLGTSVTVVAVTGSNGKTTTKGMIAHVLEGRWKGCASAKSYNNSIGVPLTLLAVEPSDVFVVCEVGTNAPGEIAALARLIEPEMAVITGVSEAHLEGLGSLEQVAAEKASLLHHVRPEGCAVVNADCEVLRTTVKRDRDLARLKRVTFGEWAEADLRLTDVRVLSAAEVQGRDLGEPGRAGRRGNGRGHPSPGPPLGGTEFTVNGRFRYRLFVPGRHNVLNALATIAVARRFSMDHAEIAERLTTYTLPPMRLTFERIGRLTLINDAYNANPASMAAAINVLADTAVQARRVLIVGDMRELGSASERLHGEVAQAIARSNVDLVVAVGENARLVSKTIQTVSQEAIETHAYASVDLAKRRLVSRLQADDTVLVKGSRALQLEKLVTAVREWAGAIAAKTPVKKKRPASLRRLKL